MLQSVLCKTGSLDFNHAISKSSCPSSSLLVIQFNSIMSSSLVIVTSMYGMSGEQIYFKFYTIYECLLNSIVLPDKLRENIPYSFSVLITKSLGFKMSPFSFK